MDSPKATLATFARATHFFPMRRPRFRSDGKPGVAFDDLGPHLGTLARRPEGDAMHDAVTKRTAVFSSGAFERPRNADELCFQFVRRGAHRRVAVTGPVRERKVGRDIWVVRGASARRVVGVAKRQRRARREEGL